MKEEKQTEAVKISPETPQAPKEVVKPKSKKPLIVFLIILAILLFLTAASLLCVLLYKEGIINIPKINISFDNKTDDKTTEEVKETATDEPKVETPTETTSTGKYVTTQVPTGWSVKEYYNGQGTDSLPSGTTYTGLTGLIIRHDGNKIFTMKAVSGIGFVGCPAFAVFEDNSATYQQEMVDDNVEVGMNMVTTNYIGTTYSEFEWLNTTFRRIGKIYFYDTKEGNNFFEPPCQSGIITLSTLKFKDGNNYTGHSYFFGATTNATEAELVVVDGILGSMALVK
ncbi:hypothetical protein M0R04_02720 [Candidatus Dojkabacteria bacterium]|jgi:hypothetical protein|nr:hypothetical protein [Candidatus Dojkabacteria bacterium]